MRWRKWEGLPEFMKCEEVRPYYDTLNKKKAQLIIKRIFDIICSLILIIILSPCFLVVSIWIKRDSSGPAFYKQERITQYGHKFMIYKFRTMISDADKTGSLVTVNNDSRITEVGKKIRKCRLDEIPQLFNVLRGEMSFVGTRPEVKKYVDQYSKEMYATLLLPAGVTSLASIKFRNEDQVMSGFLKDDRGIDSIYVEEVLPLKMKYNLKALASFYFLQDLVIMVNTILKV